MVRKLCSSCTVAITALFVAVQVAAEPIDVTAEHLLEVAMDARYLATDFMPDDSPRTQLGYLRMNGGAINTDVLMLGIGGYWRSNLLPDSSWHASFFSDALQMNKGDNTAVLSQAFGGNMPFALPQRLHINNVEGWALHAGVFGAFTQTFAQTWHWQAGMLLEYYDVDKFDIDFTTVDLPANFSGRLDFSARYDSYTPLFGVSWDCLHTKDWLGSVRVLKAMPKPRRGFHGRVSGSGVTSEGKTYPSIPDNYLGLSYVIEHRRSGWRMDVGGAAFLMDFEARKHEGIDPTLFLTLSAPLD